MSAQRSFETWLVLTVLAVSALAILGKVVSDPRFSRTEFPYAKLVALLQVKTTIYPASLPQVLVDPASGRECRVLGHPAISINRLEIPGVDFDYEPRLAKDLLGRTVFRFRLSRYGNLISSESRYSVVPDFEIARMEGLLRPSPRKSYGITDATSIVVAPLLVLIILILFAIRRRIFVFALQVVDRLTYLSSLLLMRLSYAGTGALLSSVAATLGFCFGSL